MHRARAASRLRTPGVAFALAAAITLAAAGPAAAKRADPWKKLVAAHTHGGAKAKAEIIAFLDVQCPFCARSQKTLEQLDERYGKDLRIVVLHHPLGFHEDARPAALAIVAAAKQRKAWEMQRALFEHQRDLTEETLLETAQALRLDMRRFDRDRAAAAVGAYVDRNAAVALAVGATGTPTFFIGGRELRGAQPFEKFVTLVDEEIAAAAEARKRGPKWLGARLEAANLRLYQLVVLGQVPAPDEKPDQKKERPPRKREIEQTVYRATVRPDDPARGPADALVTLVVFSEFQCPYCRKLMPTLDQLLRRFEGDLRWVVKQNPLPFHEHALPAARAALCAHQQGQYWPMHDALLALFAETRDLDDFDYAAHGAEHGLDREAFAACLEGDAVAGRIAEDQKLAATVTARGTPTTFVNGRKIAGSQPLEAFVALVEEELAKAKALVTEGGVTRAGLYEHIIAGGEVQQALASEVSPLSAAGCPRVGSADAPVQVHAFIDYQCPHCAKVVRILGELREHYGERLSVVYRMFPLSNHAEARTAAHAALCAHAQSDFEVMHAALYRDQANLDGAVIHRVAGELGLDLDRFRPCLGDRAIDAQIEADIAEGKAAGVKGTPTIFLNGRRYRPPRGWRTEDFIAAIDTEILGEAAAAAPVADPPPPAPAPDDDGAEGEGDGDAPTEAEVEEALRVAAAKNPALRQVMDLSLRAFADLGRLLDDAEAAGSEAALASVTERWQARLMALQVELDPLLEGLSEEERGLFESWIGPGFMPLAARMMMLSTRLDPWHGTWRPAEDDYEAQQARECAPACRNALELRRARLTREERQALDADLRLSRCLHRCALSASEEGRGCVAKARDLKALDACDP